MLSFLTEGQTYLIVELNYKRARFIRVQFFPKNDYKKCNLNTRYYRFEELETGECWTIEESRVLRNVLKKNGEPLVTNRFW